MSDLQKLQELTADAAQRGVTFNNVELGRSDAGDLILQTTTSGSAIEISIPEPLHIPISTVNMSTGQLDEKADMDESLRDWVNAYLAALVTDEDRQTLSGIREAIDAENLTANSAFRGLGIANFLTINTKIEALNQALLAPSVVATNKGQVLLPILGAARPGNMGVPLNITAGGSFRATGKDIQDEIRVTAGRFDSMHSLNAHGRVLSFGATFSLPAMLSLQDQRTLVIGRNFNETRTVGQAQVPKAWADGSAIKMSYCPVALGGNPRAAQLAFRTALKHLDLTGQDVAWSTLRNYNVSRLFEAYVATGDIKHDGLRKKLAESIACQIETMLKSI